jgi:hypothetical protein
LFSKGEGCCCCGGGEGEGEGAGCCFRRLTAHRALGPARALAPGRRAGGTAQAAEAPAAAARQASRRRRRWPRDGARRRCEEGATCAATRRGRSRGAGGARIAQRCAGQGLKMARPERAAPKREKAERRDADRRKQQQQQQLTDVVARGKLGSAFREGRRSTCSANELRLLRLAVRGHGRDWACAASAC